MFTFVQKQRQPCRLTVSILLVTVVQALTLPINYCGDGQILSNTTSDHKTATNCAPNVPTINLSTNTTPNGFSSQLSLPPEPFLYRIPTTPYIIKYTNYGSPIPFHHAIQLLVTAQEEMMYEISLLPDHVDVQFSRTRVWAEETARLTIMPTPSMRHSTCGMMLAGIIGFGGLYGFVEADMVFLSVRDPFRPFANGTLAIG